MTVDEASAGLEREPTITPPDKEADGTDRAFGAEGRL